MLRAAFLWLSEQPSIFRFVRRNGLARKLASRFVAGETVDDAITTLRDVSSSHLSASLDLLGESVRHADEAQRGRCGHDDPPGRAGAPLQGGVPGAGGRRLPRQT